MLSPPPKPPTGALLSPELNARLRAGDLRVLSRLITRVEDAAGDVLALMDGLWACREGSAVLGVTGPPGAGKSTFGNRLIHDLRCRGHQVAVLAVDPSSPFTGGAILGDRIRMQEHADDSGVFIRSLGTRGQHGGLTRSTLEAAILCAAAGFDRILVETVGVGQTELDVVGIADQVLVLLVPEAGDAVQTMKAGLLEGGDLFAVNKADRPGADRLVKDLRAMTRDAVTLSGLAREPAPVFAISSLDGAGLDVLFDELDGRLCRGDRSPRQLAGVQLAARLLGEERGARSRRAAEIALGSGGALEALGEELSAGRENPYAAVRRMLDGGL